MMRLTGVGGETRYGKRMTGVAPSKGEDKENSKVLKMGKGNEIDDEEDNAVKKLQSQINTLRDKIQEIGKNETMDPKTKAELIQSTKEQITELNVQLKQREADLAQEKLEREEKAQKENQPDSEDKNVSKNTGRAKYDTYSSDGDDSVKNVSKLGAAAISASNSIELSRMQRYNMTYKKNSIGILKKEIVEDTDYIGKTVFTGHETKEIGKVLGDDDPRVKAEAESENGIAEDSPLKKQIEVPLFEKKFEFLRGAGIEAKEDQIARYRTEISGLVKMQAEHLGDALQAVNGYNEDAAEVNAERAGKTSETAGQTDETVSARLPKIASDNTESDKKL